MEKEDIEKKNIEKKKFRLWVDQINACYMWETMEAGGVKL